MRYDHAQSIIQRLNIQRPIIFQDIDGPGTKNIGIVEKTERPEKGILVHLIGYKYPYKGIPDEKAVYDLAIIKKDLFSTIKIFRSKYIMAMAGLIMIMPSFIRNGLLLPIVEHFKYLITENYLYFHLLKPHRYSTCVRELYRVFGIIIARQKSKVGKMIWEISRDLICMTVENDSAYKFRFQDILPLAKGFTPKEIERLFDIAIQRERENSMKIKWHNLKKVFVRAMWVPQIRGSLARFFKELNLEEIKLDEADWYFCTMRQDYNFGGKTLETRIKEREQIEGDNWVNFKDLANDFIRENKEKIEVQKRQRSENPIYRGLK